MEADGRVLQRGADCHRVAVVVDEGRADAVLHRVVEENGTTPVELGIERLELLLGAGAVEDRAADCRAQHPELVEAALHLLQRRVDVRQGQHDVRRDPLWIAVGKIGIAVVEHLDGFDAFRLVR